MVDVVEVKWLISAIVLGDDCFTNEFLQIVVSFA